MGITTTKALEAANRAEAKAKQRQARLQLEAQLSDAWKAAQAAKSGKDWAALNGRVGDVAELAAQLDALKTGAADEPVVTVEG